jgi:CRP/FNR family cyclic AMP-dependent transcriptional regulator
VSAPAGAVSAALLGGQPFFQGLSEGFVASLAPSSRQVDFDAGAPIAREGDPARAFFLVVHGKVGLELVPHDRPRLTVLTLGPGEAFGWSWLVEPNLWRSDARALKPTRVLAIDAAPLRAAIDRFPADGVRFLTRFVPVLARRLDATRLQLLDIHRP